MSQHMIWIIRCQPDWIFDLFLKIFRYKVRVVDFVRFPAMSAGRVLPAISLKMKLEIGPTSEFDVKFHEESIYDVSRYVG